jgi:ATP-dependent Lhr-like helicase
MLDALCLTGDVGWSRLSSAATTSTAEAASRIAAGKAPAGATPIALFLREHAAAWHTLARAGAAAPSGGESPRIVDETADAAAARVLGMLRERGASFFRDLTVASELDASVLRNVLARLVGAGLVTSDGFSGLRAIVQGNDALMSGAGRWSATPAAPGEDGAEGEAVGRSGAGARSRARPPDPRRDASAMEMCAWALLRRYGVVFRRLLAREASPVSWRDITRVYRRLEARGEIRGGRFVAGMSGEQFALPDAVEQLREIRRTAPAGQLLAISAADPLNLAGILDAGERVRAVAANRIVYRDGVALAAMEGDYIRPLTPIDPALATDVASTLAGRRVPPILSGYVGRTG